MSHVMSKTIKYCRWCSKSYTAARPLYHDGFCSPTCKQAHYRAYKKWVTQRRESVTPGPGKSVTRKKPGRRRGMIRSKVV